MPLDSGRFDLATSGRADPDRYLILGFDTEYQRYLDQPERRLENEVFQQKVRQRMSDLVSNSALTVIASHNRKLLKDVCNKGVWLENGRIEKIGEIDDVLNVYAERLSLGR